MISAFLLFSTPVPAVEPPVACCGVPAEDAVRVDVPPGSLVIEADSVVVDAGRVTGNGNVHVLLGAERVDAAAFIYDPATGRMDVSKGTWLRAEGRLAFEEAHVDLQGASSEIRGITFVSRDSRVHLSAARVLLGDGPWEASDVTLSTCGCERPPWSVRARHLRIDPGKEARFRGGWLEVASVPLLPVPWGSIPLSEQRSGILPPEVAWTGDGPDLGLPLYLMLGRSADITATPAWNLTRGPRLATELRYTLPSDQGGVLHATAGRDLDTRSWRGLMQVAHGQAAGPTRSAASGIWTSDEDYLEDYHFDYLSRQLPFRELRGLAGYGPLRLEHDGIQDPLGAPQELGALVLTLPTWGARPVDAWLGSRLAADGTGTSVGSLDGSWLDLGSEAGLRAAASLGVVEAEAQTRVAGGIVGEGGRTGREGQVEAEARATLPMWADHGSFRHLLRVGLAGGVTRSAEDGTWPDDALRLAVEPAWWAGPELDSQWLGSRGVPVHGRVAIPWTSEGLAPRVWGEAAQGAWKASLVSEAILSPGQEPRLPLLAAQAGRDDGRLDLSLGYLMGTATGMDLSQVTGRAGLTLGLAGDTWTPSWRARLDTRSGNLLYHAFDLGYASRCRCLGLGLGLAWYEDQTWPDLSFRVDTHG